MNLNCLVVDDEQLARKLLESFIAKMPNLTLVQSCKNPMEAMEVLQNQHVDLLFLDIQMPDLLGTDLVKVIPQKPAVIFTTAYKEYALEGFELQAVDYLLKPFSFERFAQAANKAHALLSAPAAAQPTPGPAVVKSKTFLTVKADHRLYRINYSDLLYVEGLKEYVTFYTSERKIVSLESLKQLESDLPSDQFVRVHRSYIVNKGKVDALYGNQLEIGEKAIPIGASYKAVAVKELFG